MGRSKTSEIQLNVFGKGGSAAFLVESTFQLMCAREAIHEFEIEDYLIVMTTFPTYGPRTQQMLDFASKQGLSVEKVNMQSVDFDAFLASDSTLDLSHKRYDRVFIGNLRCLNMLVLVADYARVGAPVIAMDDGAASIGDLKGIYFNRRPASDWVSQYHWYQDKKFYINRYKAIIRKLEEKGIYYTQSLFTIFDDIQSSAYRTYKNSFHYLLSHSQVSQDAGYNIIVIGTITDELARIYDVDPPYMEQIVSEKLHYIKNKYPQYKIVFIPHPRDVSTNIKSICVELGIQYCHLSEPVEYFAISNKNSLKCVFGFGSTAVIVLKKILPGINVVDFEFSYTNKQDIDIIRKAMNQYYQQSGVVMNPIVLSSNNITNKDIGFLKNCLNLLGVVKRKIKRHCK